LHLDTRFHFTSQMCVISVKSSSLLFQILHYSRMHAVLRTASKPHLFSPESTFLLPQTRTWWFILWMLTLKTFNLDFFFTLVYNEWQRGIFTVM
jgi:hypothetical protein